MESAQPVTHTELFTHQTIRGGRIAAQKHTAILYSGDAIAARIEAPSIPTLQRAVEGAGGRFRRNAITVVKERALDD